MKTVLLLFSLIITSPFVDAQDLGDPNCDSLLLVSSWSRDNVKIYDGCDGEYIRDLAETGVLNGPQAIFQDSHGDVVVVSESNHKLVKFDQATLNNATTVIEPGLMNNPITVVKNGENRIFLGSYSSNQIIELDTNSWQSVKTVLPANNGQIQGIDIGMAMGPDGQLYVPGYDSDSILRVNPITSATSQFVASGSNNLDRPRSILFLADRMLVTAWGNAAIFNYGLNGQFVGTAVPNFVGAAGMIADGPDHMLVTSDRLNTVRRYNVNDFTFETVVASNSGGLAGATYVYRLQKKRTSEEVTGMHQAWVTGVGRISDNQILVTEFATTLGGHFGADFNPDDIETILWGEVLFEFTGCHFADMSYASVLSTGGTAFGAGGYPVRRLAMNPNGLNCEQVGFDQVTGKNWMQGTYYGGTNRSGEGFTVDVLDDERAIVTWFTYLPLAEVNP